jgi:hypothetical protein
MDPDPKRALKEQLLSDIGRWKPSEPRGFQDIVRNAADIDKKLLYGLMKAFNVKREEVRAWGSGADLPSDYDRYAIVEKIRELLEADLGAPTEA